MSFLILDHVSKSFGRPTVIQDAFAIVERGETVAIVGPSGSGKTVLLRLIAGVYPIDRGDIRLDGRSVCDVPAAERGVGMAFQNFALYPHMSARENVASPLRARRLPESEVRRRVDEVTALLRIDHVLDHAPRPAVERAEAADGARPRARLRRDPADARRSPAQRRREATLRDALRAAAPPQDLRRDRAVRHAGLPRGHGVR